jgi:TonB family protein
MHTAMRFAALSIVLAWLGCVSAQTTAVAVPAPEAFAVQLASKYAVASGRDRPILHSRLPLPPDRRWAELTPEQQALVRSWYAGLPAGDEPAYPERGIGAMALAVMGLFDSMVLVGRVEMLMSVQADGSVSAIDALLPLDDSVARAVARVLREQRFKPGLCKGRPCASQFPLRLGVEDPRWPRASTAPATRPTVALPTMVDGSCPALPPLPPGMFEPARMLLAPRLGPGGEPLEIDVLHGSGSPGFDAEVLAALRRCRWQMPAGDNVEAGRDGLLLLPLRAPVPDGSASGSAPTPDCVASLFHDRIRGSWRPVERGRTVVRVTTDAQGQVERLELTGASGSPLLDRLVLDVRSPACKAPPRRDSAGVAVRGQSTVIYDWRIE